MNGVPVSYLTLFESYKDGLDNRSETAMNDVPVSSLTLFESYKDGLDN